MLTLLPFLSEYLFLAPVLMAISAIIILFSLDRATFPLSVGTILLVISSILFFGLTNPAAIWAHLPYLIGGILLYIVIGIVWVRFVAWRSFISRTVEKYEDIKHAFLERRGLKTLVDGTDADRTDFKRHVEHCLGFDIPIEMRQHKARVVRWMAYWPFNLLHTLLDDPLRRLFNYAYRVMVDSLKAIATSAFAAHDDDFS